MLIKAQYLTNHISVGQMFRSETKIAYDIPLRLKISKNCTLERFLKEYYHSAEVHPHASAVRMDTMLEQPPVAGLSISCMETVLEHGCLHIVAFV